MNCRRIMILVITVLGIAALTGKVSEPDRVISIDVVGSSFPNWNGTNQKRIFTVSGDELKLTNPVASTGGGTTEVVWKRAK